MCVYACVCVGVFLAFLTFLSFFLLGYFAVATFVLVCCFIFVFNLAVWCIFFFSLFFLSECFRFCLFALGTSISWPPLGPSRQWVNSSLPPGS